MNGHRSVCELTREIPVVRTCDVLVVGGGPAGTAAAASAARMGADTVLLPRSVMEKVPSHVRQCPAAEPLG